MKNMNSIPMKRSIQWIINENPSVNYYMAEKAYRACFDTMCDLVEYLIICILPTPEDETLEDPITQALNMGYSIYNHNGAFHLYKF